MIHVKTLSRKKPYKKCPRCGNKCLENQTRCEECDLIFPRLVFATNKAAKQKLAHFDRDFVIFTSDLPKDVSYWKLFFLTLFLGLFGAHYYYVGKYIKGFVMDLGFVYLMIGVFFNDVIVAQNLTFLYLPIAFYALAWIISFSFVILHKFKVPIYVDEASLQVQKDNAKSELGKLEKEIAMEKEQLSNKNKSVKNKAGEKSLKVKENSKKHKS